MDKDIEFDVVGIAKVLKEDKYKVPPNQREYSWMSEVQVTELLQDISNALRKPDKPYFLGTIVLTTIKGSGLLEIADGQQRLATTTMILSSHKRSF